MRWRWLSGVGLSGADRLTFSFQSDAKLLVPNEGKNLVQMIEREGRERTGTREEKRERERDRQTDRQAGRQTD